MFKFEYNGVTYEATSIKKLQNMLKKAGLKISLESLLFDEQEEILNEVLNEQSNIANQDMQDIVNEEIQDIINEETKDVVNQEYATILSDKKVNNKLN